MTQREAGELMGVSEREVRKLLRRMKTQGDAVAVHGLRGRASNRKIDPQVQAQAIEILKLPDWHDFGPTFAGEQLAKLHQIRVGKEGNDRGVHRRVLYRRDDLCQVRDRVPVCSQHAFGSPGCRIRGSFRVAHRPHGVVPIGAEREARAAGG